MSAYRYVMIFTCVHWTCDQLCYRKPSLEVAPTALCSTLVVVRSFCKPQQIELRAFGFETQQKERNTHTDTYIPF